MFQNSLMAGAAGQGGFYDYQIDQSLRFNDNDSAYLSRTPASAGDRKTWTWSGWVKRGNLGTRNALFEVRVNGTNFCSLVLFETNAIFAYSIVSAIDYGFLSNDIFRDTSAWYHIVWVMDTTNATSSDRMRLYVNNRRIASFGDAAANYGEFPLNYEPLINTTSGHNIGLYVDSGNYFDGYMAEVNFIDGLALDPTSFGELKSGIWVPKAYSGSYGTNGFYLTFEDSAAIGDDLSGNANDWTPSGLASTDVMLDSPTNNYAVLNNLAFSGSAGLLADGNLAYRDATGSAIWKSRWSTIALPTTGKWYAEFTLSYTGSTGFSFEASVGLHDGLSATGYVGASAGSYGYLANGNKYNNASPTAYGASYGNGSVIGVAWDADTGDLTFYKNGVSQGVAYSGVSPENKFLGLSTYWVTPDGTTWWYPNFGQSPFAYTPPSGFLPLNTANLPDPAIDPAQDDVPADYFNTVLYTGDGVQDRTISGVGFQPDWSWIKNRAATGTHVLIDAIRGGDKQLFSNLTNAEQTSIDITNGFATDGFILGDNVSGTGSTNQSGNSYVAWNWKANGAGVSNTDGTITSTVSANTKAGFSIVSVAGQNNTSTLTVGHGLGAAPKLLIGKSRSAIGGWAVWHPALATNELLYLHSTAAKSVDGGTPPAAFSATSSTTFTVQNWNRMIGSGATGVFYAFAEVEGFSKFGSYTGNGSADGPFVYCGFRPKFLMTKRTDNAFGGDWYMWDDERQTYNVMGPRVLANGSDAEGSGTDLDLLSNGFKLRSSAANFNASGGTYIFAAFAEAPFKYSNAR